DIAQEQFKPSPIELTVWGLQLWVGRDAACDIGVGDAEPHLTHALIESRLCNHFAKHLAINAESVSALGRQRLTELAADQLQPILVILPEAIYRDFGVADFGERGAAKAAENIVDAPNGEAAREQRHHRSHDAATEPIFGGFANTSEHAAT